MCKTPANFHASSMPTAVHISLAVVMQSAISLTAMHGKGRQQRGMKYGQAHKGHLRQHCASVGQLFTLMYDAVRVVFNPTCRDGCCLTAW